MSAFSLDEAIKNIKDENAVNQLVGSLEKTLENQINSVSSKERKNELFKSFFDVLTTTANDSKNNFGARKK